MMTNEPMSTTYAPPPPRVVVPETVFTGTDTAVEFNMEKDWLSCSS